VVTVRLEDSPHQRLLHIALDGGGHRELLDAVAVGSAAWTPDGESVLVAREGEIVRVSVADGGVTSTGLATSETRFDLSPDGMRLVFTDRTRDNANVLMIFENLLALLR
jgi:hypothetical protein